MVRVEYRLDVKTLTSRVQCRLLDAISALLQKSADV